MCVKGEQHELENNTGAIIELLAVKGHLDYSYDDLADILKRFGFSVYHGSLKIEDWNSPIIIGAVFWNTVPINIYSYNSQLWKI